MSKPSYTKTPHRTDFDEAAPLLKPPSWAGEFPESTARPSSLFTFVGVTPASTDVVRQVITENDHAYDLWERERRFAHNHFTHSALTRYALGATPALLQVDWEYDRSYLAALDPHEGGRKRDIKYLPADGQKITRDNWKDAPWFGTKGAYSAYLPFFHAEVGRLGIQGALDEYVFGQKANEGDKKMITALLAGVVHPFIHVGLGLEFDDRVIVAEGLCNACGHDLDNYIKLYPAEWPNAQLKSQGGEKKTLLGLYAEFLSRKDLDPGPYDPNKMINDRLHDALTDEHVAGIHDLVARWDLGDLSDEALAPRLEELAWTVTLLTGAVSRPGYDMHLLTSSLFVPTYLKHLAGDTRRVILQSYLMILFHLCMVRGRPMIYTGEVMSYSATPTGPMNRTDEVKGQAVGHGSSEEENPWLDIVSNALVANDSHVPKSVRALLYYAQKFGHTRAGDVPGVGEQGAIEGLENVDGSVFVRVAGKILDRLGWVKEGESEGEFDRTALGWDGAWKIDP